MSKKIAVHEYPGVSENDCPRKFDLDGQTIEVEEAIENWWEREGSRNQRHYFKVKGDDEQIYTLFYDTNRKDWYCS